MYRDIMRKVGGLPEGRLSGTGETDEGYIRAGSKGVSLGSNGENRTVPSRRRLPRGPGRGTFKKNVPMVTIYHQRATGDEPDVTIFKVPRGNGRTLAEMVAGKFEPGSTVITDEHPACKSLGEMGYGHLAINHSEGEYVSGKHNDIHTNNCECRIGLLYMVAEKTPRREQMASGTVRQVFPVRPQPQALWHQWQVRGCAGRHP
ncbi:MAG: transposase [Cenarchaeum sp. SB0665_bin_23]|nr:transposase [Cenarchaeum sp. SB0665_bin_23]MYG33482.1 transposase [Cenarchaeum sp. SB0677_bin_16]